MSEEFFLTVCVPATIAITVILSLLESIRLERALRRIDQDHHDAIVGIRDKALRELGAENVRLRQELQSRPQPSPVTEDR